MLTSEQRMRKFIHMDEQSISNLQGMRAERLKRGLTMKEVQASTGISQKTLFDYECRDVIIPRLGKYLVLADFFGWHIQGSANYLFATATYKDIYRLKRCKKRFGLTNNELAKMLHVSRNLIDKTLNFQERASIKIFAAILQVLNEEKQRSMLMKELLRKNPPKK